MVGGGVVAGNGNKTNGHMHGLQRRAVTESYNHNDEGLEPYDINKLRDDDIQGATDDIDEEEVQHDNRQG